MASIKQPSNRHGLLYVFYWMQEEVFIRKNVAVQIPFTLMRSIEVNRRYATIPISTTQFFHSTSLQKFDIS